MAFRSRTRRDVARLLGYELPQDQKSGQDHLVVDADHQHFAVADGVGGSLDGGAAARVACEVFRERAPSYRLGITAVMEALPDLYVALHGAVKQTESQTTFTGGIVTHDGYVAWIHAGDSRLFYLPAYGDLYELSQPQHDINERHRLSNALGGEYGHLVLKPNGTHSHLPMWGYEKVSPGDRLVFTTDGLGPLGYDGMNDEYQWWMDRVARCVSRTALEAVNEVFDQSYIRDDGSLIVVDIGTDNPAENSH